MGKYEPLTAFLAHQPGDEIVVPFGHIEDADGMGIELPYSARHHREWWDNKATPKYRQCRAWLDAGWEVSRVDFSAESVTFRRRQD